MHQYPAANQEHRGGADDGQRTHESRCQPKYQSAESLSGLARLLQEVKTSVVELDDSGNQAIHTNRHQNSDRRQDHDLRAHGRVLHRAERDDDDLGGQDRVRTDGALDTPPLEFHHVDFRIHDGIEPLLTVCLVFRPGVQQRMRNLLEALVTKERTAKHQQRRDEPRQERAEQQRAGNKDGLVNGRSLEHGPNDRQFPVSPDARDLLRVQGEVVAQHARSLLRRYSCLLCGDTGHRRNVVEQRGNVIN